MRGLLLATALVAVGCSRPTPALSAPAASSSPVPVPVPVPDPASTLPAPSNLTAAAETAFAVRIAWTAVPSALGYELESASDGAFRVAALVASPGTSFDHHARLPGRTYAYRVRAFDRSGASSAWATASATTPRDTGPVALPLPPRACTKLPPEVPSNELTTMPRQRLDAGGGPALYDDPVRGQPMTRRLFGEVQGCLRELGTFMVQDAPAPIDGVVDAGFPLLRAVAGAGAEGAEVVTLRYAHGRYDVVDRAMYCGVPAPDDTSPPRYAPPYGCQRDPD